MRLPENRRYSMGVSKNPFPRSPTSENDFLYTHLVSTIFLATLHSFAIFPIIDFAIWHHCVLKELFDNLKAMSEQWKKPHVVSKIMMNTIVFNKKNHMVTTIVFTTH